jgi:hypothetical protein
MTEPESGAANNPPSDDLLNRHLLQYPAGERAAWRAEALRLARIISTYARIKPKRRRNPDTGRPEFTPEVRQLCEQVRCRDAVIVARQPHRARSVSPYTLDDWLREWREQGAAVFLRQPHTPPQAQQDRRRAVVSTAAVNYINENWRRFRSPRALYRALSEEGGRQGWTLPSESWLYRRWREMPQVVRVAVLEGKAAYESRCAPYVPRNYEDLAALQVVCGDHSERDVTVLAGGKELARPWLTVWQCLRTGLIWGWYLGLRPSSETARLAYADGVLNFGAQPFARPDDDFYSYIYTDRGKDYCSHDWAGKMIAVHQQAMNPDDLLECHLVERRVGVLAEFGVRRLLARGYNAKEKPVERFFKAVSEWEANTFAEYCGSHPQARPDKWRELYRQHEQFLRGGQSPSPFMAFDEYHGKLRPHERVTLGGLRVVPLEEFRRLYTTRYEMSPETVALALLKSDSRTIRKNGVACFRRDWSYWHPDFSALKGQKIEVRFTERDYRRVWVVLPDKRVVEAPLVTPTPLLHPDPKTLRLVARTRRREKQLIEEFRLLAQSRLRGESVEERVERQLSGQPESPCAAAARAAASVHRLSRLDHGRLKSVAGGAAPAVDEPADDLAAPVIFHEVLAKVSEFDGQE